MGELRQFSDTYCKLARRSGTQRCIVRTGRKPQLAQLPQVVKEICICKAKHRAHEVEISFRRYDVVNKGLPPRASVLGRPCLKLSRRLSGAFPGAAATST